MAKKLRYGWTTGACATAAARAAVRAIKQKNPQSINHSIDHIDIELPRHKSVRFAIERCRLLSSMSAEASVIKDAGDDPDVTHGAEIIVEVRLLRTREILFFAGSGVGTVTKRGLPLAVGEAAINPGPRAYIASNMRQEWGDVTETSGEQGFAVTVSVADGERIAESTWNSRLGIIGGLSILGTSGVVVPYSCSAWIHSIHRGIDVGRAAGSAHLGAATGKQSEAALRREFGLDEGSILDMGDFVGGMLKYLRRYPVPRLTIAGGFGKMVKLSQGAMDLHSRRSQIDFTRLGDVVSALGGDSGLCSAVRGANTALEVRELCAGAVDIAAPVARDAQRQAQAFVGDKVALNVMVVGRESEVLAMSHGA